MTDNEPEKPFYKNSSWIRSVIIGEAIVFGGLIASWGVSWLIHAIGGMLIHSEGHRYAAFIITFPFYFPAFVEMIFLEKVLNIHGEEMMLYIIPMFASLVLWWIFLGVVFGSIIDRVRVYLQRKEEN